MRARGRPREYITRSRSSPGPARGPAPRAPRDPFSRAPSAASRRASRSVRGILCGASRSAQNRRTATCRYRRSRSADDAGDDLLAAARIGRRQHPDVGDAGHVRSTCSTSFGLHFPAGDVDERGGAARQRQLLLRVPGAVVAGQEAASSSKPSAHRVRIAAGDRRARTCTRPVSGGASSSGSRVTVTPGSGWPTIAASVDLVARRRTRCRRFRSCRRTNES